MLSIHLHLGLPSGLFPSGFPTNNLSYWPSLTQFYYSGGISQYSDELRAGWLEFDYQQGQDLIFTEISRPDPGPSLPPIQWQLRGFLYSGKPPVYKADLYRGHEQWRCTYVPLYVFGAQSLIN
jgi:hypothetical protein